MEQLYTSFLFGLVVAATVGCEPTVPVAESGLCIDVGTSVPAEDDCNTCTCESNHTWSCTRGLCVCVPGTSKPAEDGCNVCSCTTGGRWVCTKKMCPADACAEGLKSYESYRERLVSQPGGVGCATDADCTLIHENNRCAASCGIALPTSIAAAIEQRLETQGNNFCESCPPVAIPPCLPMVAQCVGGVCSTGPSEPR